MIAHTPPPLSKVSGFGCYCLCALDAETIRRLSSLLFAHVGIYGGSRENNKADPAPTTGPRTSLVPAQKRNGTTFLRTFVREQELVDQHRAGQTLIGSSHWKSDGFRWIRRHTHAARGQPRPDHRPPT